MTETLTRPTSSVLTFTPMTPNNCRTGERVLDEVHVGRDDWLFLNGGTNQPIKLFTDPTFFKDRHIEGWIDRIRHRGTEIEAIGAQYFHMFAPEKISVMYEEYEAELPLFDRRPCKVIRDRLEAEGLSRFYLDLEEPFRAAKATQPVYRKTDTHWAPEGTYLALTLICERLGVAPAVKLADRMYRERVVAGDLGSKLDPKHSELWRNYRFLQNASRIAGNGLVQEADKVKGAFPGGLLSGSHVVFRNESPDAHDLRVMVFGDSFCEVRPGNGLTNMLAETFRELHFFWSSSVDLDEVRAASPDVVISELAERFAVVLPNDQRSLKEYAEGRLQAYLEKKAV